MKPGIRGSLGGSDQNDHSLQAGYPNTHAVVAGKVLAPDGRWLALDARGLMADQHTLTGLYHAGLRAELTCRLGVAWQEPVRGLAEIAGFEERVLEAFSPGRVRSRRART